MKYNAVTQFSHALLKTDFRLSGSRSEHQFQSAEFAYYNSANFVSVIDEFSWKNIWVQNYFFYVKYSAINYLPRCSYHSLTLYVQQ